MAVSTKCHLRFPNVPIPIDQKQILSYVPVPFGSGELTSVDYLRSKQQYYYSSKQLNSSCKIKANNLNLSLKQTDDCHAE